MSFCSVYLNMCLKQSIHPAKTAQCSVSRPVPDSLPSPACPHLFLFRCVFVSVSHRHYWRANNTQFECLAYSRPFSAITWAGWAASSSNPRLLCGSVVYASTTFSFVISIRIMGNVWSCIWNNSIYIIILLLCNITRHQKQGHCVGPHLLLLHELQKILH